MSLREPDHDHVGEVERMTAKPHFGIEKLPLYKAVDSGERIHDVVIKVTYVPATREDVLAAVRELGGKVVRFENFEGERGMWVSEATDEGKGRYLIVPLDMGDTE